VGLWTHLLWPEREFLQLLAVRNAVVRRIVDVADPDEIIVFGSVARGRQHRKSDLDLLVVKSGVTDPQGLARTLQAHLFGIRMPVDIIVVRPEDIHEARGKLFTFLGRILQDGKTVYRSGAEPPRSRWSAEFAKSVNRLNVTGQSSRPPRNPAAYAGGRPLRT
jgi:predicted nucleotidyltransferase